jgi:uncharacterized delta-60 repeat protein
VLIGGYVYTRYYDPNEGGITPWTEPFIRRFNADGSRDTNFNEFIGAPDPGLTDTVLHMRMVVQPDDKALFTFRGSLKRLNANGTPDSSFIAAVGPVFGITLKSDGKVLIIGSFGFVNGTNRGGIARLNPNGSLDNSFNPGTGANGNVSSIGLQPDGNILIAGDFLTVNGVLRPYVARLYGDSPWPSLKIARSNAFVIVSWLVSGLDFQLQETTKLALPNSWSPVVQPAATNGNQVSVNLPTTIGSKFFRLKSQ